MIEKQNIDIIDLLQHAEPTSELYKSLLLYTPSQNHSAYEWRMFGTKFLTAINNMVSVIFKKWYIRGVMYLVHYIGFWWWRESLQQTSEYHCTLRPQEISPEPFIHCRSTWCGPNYGSVSFGGRCRPSIKQSNGRLPLWTENEGMEHKNQSLVCKTEPFCTKIYFFLVWFFNDIGVEIFWLDL